jgi:hypothetical protein
MFLTKVSTLRILDISGIDRLDEETSKTNFYLDESGNHWKSS